MGKTRQFFATACAGTNSAYSRLKLDYVQYFSKIHLTPPTRNN